MYYYQVTKYNPKYRNEKGCYTKDEWTSISDVGTKYDENLFTIEEYTRIEDLYINAVFLFMDCLGLQTLTCSYIEKPSEIYDQNAPEELKTLYKRLDKEFVVTKEQLRAVLQMNLREFFWCKLKNNTKMFVHFGYDCYMYIGVEKECTEAVNQINQSGLFVEEFVSPYLYQDIDEDDEE